MSGADDSLSIVGGPWKIELIDLVRGASGGLLFGVPLLYTMEVWWIGSTTKPGASLGVLAVSFTIILVLNRTSGFRHHRDVRWSDAAIDAVEALAVALLCVTLVLVMLREVTMATPLREVLGKIVYESTPFAIGIGLAHNFLRRGRTDSDDEGGKDGGSAQPKGTLRATLTDVSATVVGAVFVAFNIAPTDEIPMLAASATPVSLLAVIALSLVISYAIVFEAGFSREEQRRQQQGILQHPLTETVGSYVVALVTAVLMLSLVGNLDVFGSWQDSLAQVVLLGFPAAIGGAAGRLAV